MTTTRTRQTGPDRKANILQAAIRLAERDGFVALSRDNVAREAKVSGGLVLYFWFAMDELKKAVVQHAIATEHLPILVQSMAMGNPVALAAPRKLRQAAAKTLGV